MSLPIASLPVFIAGFAFLAWAWKHWSTRFDRGNGRPAVPCGVCGKKVQRGLPMQQHVKEAHEPKDGRK